MPKIRTGLNNVFPTKPLPVVPTNFGMEKHVEAEIERTIEVANARYNTALATNGIPVMIYRRCRQGFVCTCQSTPLQADDPENDYQEGFSPADQPPRSNVIRVQGSQEIAAHTRNPQDRVLGVDIGETDDENGRGSTFEKESDSRVQSEGTPDYLDHAFDQYLYAGTATTTCGICFGSGFTNGYSLYAGQRIVLESHTLADNKGFSVEDPSDAPLTYEGNADATLTWSLKVPAFFKNAWINARNNIKKADVEILINDAPIPLQGLAAFKGQTVNVSVRAYNDDAKFTHVELILQFADWPFTQMDNIQEDLSYNAPEATQTLDFPFSPSVQRLEREDCFVDLKYGKVWRVNTVTDYKTTPGQVVTWQVSATSRTSFDILSLMKLPMFPSYFVSYRNLEI